ncbi:ferritin-like domain-containing protein [Nocardioides caldifontis]|uniref:ferritin-like domain-containing protein n=1 Tax=Nocardioides caldifontis TaxID=2588938 RepID=UPI001396C560|nr:ferritin-like domain-containing protein [Nocardioides caldifontis]
MRPLEALQATLAAEHAAVHAYGVVGGRLPSADNPALAERFRSAYEAHRGRRDWLRSRIADRGADPSPAALGYSVPVEGRDPVELTSVARGVEERCAAVYAQLVASSTGEDRRWGLDALTSTSVLLLSLGAEPTAFPGAPEL